MIPYIGDISKADAEVLAFLAEKSANILEFGCGASTQVISAYKGISLFTSIDTSEEWITKTQNNIDLILGGADTQFQSYDLFMQQLNNTTLSRQYDFVFDDGVDSLRRDFAIKIWPHIRVGGALAFHDTRRAHDFRNVLEVCAHYQNEIEEANFNFLHSNITILIKKEPEPYDNWQITENKQPWQLGYGDIPEEEKLRIKEILKQK